MARRQQPKHVELVGIASPHVSDVADPNYKGTLMRYGEKKRFVDELARASG